MLYFQQTNRYMITKKQFYLIFSFLLFFFTFTLFSQNSPPSPPPPGGQADFEYSFELSKVTFYNDNTISIKNWIRLKNDPIQDTGNVIKDNGFVSNSSVSTDIFDKVNITNKDIPVCYVSGSKGRVSAEFITNCIQKVYIRATNSDGYNLPEILITPSNGKLIYNVKPFVKKFPDEYVYYNNEFKLNWEFRLENSTVNDYKTIDASQNFLFVTHDKPSLDESSFYVSFFDLSCRFANGQRLEDNIFTNISSNFKNKCVHRYRPNKDCMGYWVDPSPPQSDTICFTGQALVAYENATCGAWADLLVKLGKSQGNINSEISTVTYTNGELTISDKVLLDSLAMEFFGNQYGNLEYLEPIIYYNNHITGIRTDFFVNNWDVTDSSKFVINEYHNKYIGNNPVKITLQNGNQILVKELVGFPGQGNSDPRSEFDNHAIVKYNNKYYDPSYGSNIAYSKNDWETPALSAMGSVMRLYVSSTKYYYINWIGHINTNTLQCTINP